MATSNFHSMEDFPLMVLDTEQFMCKTCPECYTGGQPDDATKCDYCGADLTEVESAPDDVLIEEMVNRMEEFADNMNDEAGKFYEVKVMSGYYSGVQFYVDDNYPDLDSYDDDDCDYEFGMSKDEAVSEKEKAESKINEMLKEAKKELGLYELGVSARFSNGETIYAKL